MKHAMLLFALLCNTSTSILVGSAGIEQIKSRKGYAEDSIQYYKAHTHVTDSWSQQKFTTDLQQAKDRNNKHKQLTAQPTTELKKLVVGSATWAKLK